MNEMRVMEMQENNIFDVTVVGGGPAGLFSTFYSGLRDMKTKVIEYQPELGGKIHVYPEKMIWDIGGLTPAPGAKVIEQLVEQGLTFDPTVVLSEKIESIARNDAGIFELYGATGDVHLSKTVIIAVGGGILNPQKLAVEGAERFEMANLNYTVKNLHHFKNKTVIISGGGNSAIDWAMELEPVAKQVFISCRNGDFTCHESHSVALQKSSVVCLFNSTITKLIADEQHEAVEKVEVTNKESGIRTELEIDEVIVSHGYERDTSLLENSVLPIERADNYFIKGNSKSESSIPGLYAAGDILMYDGKVNLIAGAFQDAANAVNRAKQYIEPKADKFAMVSSHHDVFKERNKQLVKEMMDEKTV